MTYDELMNSKPIRIPEGTRVYDDLDECWGTVVTPIMGIQDTNHVYIRWDDFEGVGRYPTASVRMNDDNTASFLPASF